MTNVGADVENPLESWLRDWVQQHGGVSGTVHYPTDHATLGLRAALRIPPPVLARIDTIPKGKGMAGLAWSRARSIDTCNLRNDTSGQVEAGAKAVEAGTAVAVPVFEAGEGGGRRLLGVAGIAFAESGELSTEQLTALETTAAAAPWPR